MTRRYLRVVYRMLDCFAAPSASYPLRNETSKTTSNIQMPSTSQPNCQRSSRRNRVRRSPSNWERSGLTSSRKQMQSQNKPVSTWTSWGIDDFTIYSVVVNRSWISIVRKANISGRRLCQPCRPTASPMATSVSHSISDVPKYTHHWNSLKPHTE